MSTVPGWLSTLATVSLAVAGCCALLVVLDELTGNAQKMWIMSIVWPVTALWAGPLGLAAYFTVGRKSTRAAAVAARHAGEAPPSRKKPFWQSTGVAALHCGSGCTLADLIVEWAVVAVPVTLFGSEVAGGWIVDFAVAFLLGIVFQYFTIAPMRGLSPREGIAAAVKADTLSLTAWQVGMYGWMAVVLFAIWSPDALPKEEPVFWFMMQLAMLAGFLTSYPVNWWLLRSGIKEIM